METENWTKRILAKLAAMDVLPTEEAARRNEDEHQRNIRDYFGLSLNRKASDAEVEAFEQKHKIRLPSDYRCFVTQIGNGGCGPGVEGIYGFQNSLWQERPGNLLSKPFPPAEPPVGQKRWSHIDVSEKTVRKYTSGLLVLSHYGCGILDRLVVCGSRFGEVWTDDIPNSGKIFPAKGWIGSAPASGGGPTFAE